VGRDGNNAFTGQALHDASDTGDKVPDALTSTKDTQQESLAPAADVEDDNDSVQGDEEELPVETGSAQNIPSLTEPMHSVVPTKPAAQSRNTEHAPRRLFSKLWSALPAGLQRSNALLLSDTVHILDSLSEMDYLRLEEIYADRFDSHQAALHAWVKSLKSVLEFYELTEFAGDVSTLDAFLADSPGGIAEAASGILVQGGSSLPGWPGYAHFSDEVTSVFYNLVVPQRLWRSGMMENKTRKFTEELLAWFM
jgi:hypothetical protein